MQHYVEIYRFSDGHVESRMGPMSERSAQKVRSGANINLNHDEWGVRIVDAATITERHHD